MITRRSKHAGAMAVFLAATGCGGLGAGDYEVYRVAAAEPQLSADCFASGAPTTGVSSDIRTGATLVLFLDSQEVPYLDTGARVFEGGRSGNEYRFLGTNLITANGFSSSQQVQIDMILDGDTVEGNYRTTSTTCIPSPTGGNCTPSSCTTDTDFDGVRVEDELADRPGGFEGGPGIGNPTPDPPTPSPGGAGGFGG